MARLREELTSKGFNLPPEKEKGEHFDSNCITPVSQRFSKSKALDKKLIKTQRFICRILFNISVHISVP